MLPTHTAQAGITLSSVGFLLGVNRAVRILLNGPIGLACDRWPRRRLFVPAVFIGALSTAVYAATHGFWPLLTGRLLWGLACRQFGSAGRLRYWTSPPTKTGDKVPAMVVDISPSETVLGTYTGLYYIAGSLAAIAGLSSTALSSSRPDSTTT